MVVCNVRAPYLADFNLEDGPRPVKVTYQIIGKTRVGICIVLTVKPG